MNKAFVREPEDTGAANCPRCGSAGIAVSLATLAAHLPADALHELSETAFYCPYPKCDVGYFDIFERTVPADSVLSPTYPKDSTAPLCNCFGFTLADLEQDLAERGVARVRALVARSKTPDAHCSLSSPSGQCCTAEVQRTYFRLKGAE